MITEEKVNSRIAFKMVDAELNIGALYYGEKTTEDRRFGFSHRSLTRQYEILTLDGSSSQQDLHKP